MFEPALGSGYSDCEQAYPVRLHSLFKTYLTTMVNPMKLTISTVALLFAMAGPFSVLAQEEAAQATTTEPIIGEPETATQANPQSPCPMHNKGMMHKHKCHHDKGRGGMKHHCKHDKKGKHERHQRVVQRLDMIEARLAKIEAMLESLMRR